MNPSTREETFMRGISNVLQGEDSGVSIAPSSRTEYFLNEILEAASGGGGGGGGLPPVTSDDNGDVLTVVEGEWAPAAPSGGGGGVFLVTFGGSYGVTPDKTVTEIAAAATARQLVVFKWHISEAIFIGFADITLSSSDGSMSHAEASAVSDANNGMLSMMKYSAGSWSATEKYL